jgi:succinate dehydrogenase/fumarate reductase cytochrome b subunit
VAVVLYHAFNGVRIMLLDMGIGVHRHKAVFWVCMASATGVLAVFGLKASSFILG